MPGSAVVPDDKIAFLLVTGLCSGMSIITCGFVIFTMGVSFNLRSDRNRQQFLAMISFCAAVFGVVGNGLQEGRHGTSVGDKVVSFFFNWFVQLGLAGIAHTSVIRLLTAVLRSPAPSVIGRATLICCIFYFLTLPAMTPTFISLTHPSNTGVKAVSRNMNIAFVCAIELFAVTADIMLLHRFTQHKRNSQRVRLGMMKDMWIVYAFVWLSICADVTAKIYRDVTNKLIPDLAITNLTLTLRCMAALMYGTTIHNALELSTQPSSLPIVKRQAKPFASTGGGNSEIKLVEIGDHHKSGFSADRSHGAPDGLGV